MELLGVCQWKKPTRYVNGGRRLSVLVKRRCRAESDAEMMTMKELMLVVCEWEKLTKYMDGGRRLGLLVDVDADEMVLTLSRCALSRYRCQEEVVIETNSLPRRS